ncbi:MAG: T9SS type A sorting domain-containing protein [Chitinophagaceae bacterium]|nr:T9SS type A sorting domain-containing protein [Chitinophagaceae bacterium]
MKTRFQPVKKLLLLILLIAAMGGTSTKIHAQATYAVPVSIGNKPCGSGKGFVQFRYTSSNQTLDTLSPTTCNLSNLANPGFDEYNAGISFNPKDTSLYYTRYKSPHTYVWRWKPGAACPPATALLTVYNNTYVIGLTFDSEGMGYQLIYTGSYPYGLALQSVNFTTGTLGPIVPVSLPSGLNPLAGNGDFIITPTGQFLAILDNNYITINYQDYGTGPLHATLISKLSGNTIIGLSYADGKLVASDYYVTGGKYRSNYYEIGIVDGAKTTITTAPCYFSTDMTDINSAIGVAKSLSSVTATGTPGTYDLCYDIYVQNYGNWPLSSVRLKDNLGTVYGSGNISNVSVSLIDNPAGVVLDTTFNGVNSGGVDRTNLLVDTLSRLPASPAAMNHFTLRICFRVKNIVIGRVYNNSAFAYARGYLSANLTDKSTNGSNPDLNSNAKPDDVGEDQPTPFVILTTAEMPPCDALNRILYMQNFGTGNPLATAIPAATGSAGTAGTEYTGSTSQPLAVETYALTNNANKGNTSRWISLTDHTTGSGRMMVLNADVKGSKVYRDTINIPCTNLKYSLFAFASNIANSSYETFCNDAFGGLVYPKLIFTVRNASNGNIITNLTTPEITSAAWTQYGMKFVMPAGVTKVVIEINNAAAGGCGNDLAIDDIQFGLCDPTPTVTVNSTAGCSMGTTTFSAALNDPTVISGTLDYQWQVSSNNSSWSNISGANNVTYTINPLMPSDIGKYYRVIVAAAGNINNTNCRYISNSFQLTAKTSSTAPTGIAANPAFTTCTGNPVTLTVQGGSLGTNAVWRWYTGSCGGTLVGTGASVTVYPSTSTTYYARAEGDCNTTTCAQATVTVSTCTILPIDFLQFSAVQRSASIDLNWRIITTEQISHFEVERSTDGTNFGRIGEVKKAVPQNEAVTLTYQDASLHVNTDVLYYRICVVSKDGVRKYSNVLVVRLSNRTGEKLKISPNPASSSVQISFNTSVRGPVEYQILDMTGKVVLRKQYMAESGQNSITVNDLDRLSEGVYTLVLRLGDRWEHERLVIKK